jgi:hypothetical protein
MHNRGKTCGNSSKRYKSEQSERCPKVIIAARLAATLKRVLAYKKP